MVLYCSKPIAVEARFFYDNENNDDNDDDNDDYDDDGGHECDEDKMGRQNGW